jgi:capsular exopolysaccharide synthesis family protein
MSSGHDQLPGLPAEPDRSRTPREPAPASSYGRLANPASSGDGLRPVTAGATAIEPVAMLKAFRRRWPVAIGLGLLAAGLAAGAAWLVVPPAKYTAYASLKIDSNRPTIIFPLKETVPDSATYQETQVNLIKSRLVLDKALDKPRVQELEMVKEQEDPAEWLSDTLRIASSPRSQLIVLSISGDKPGELATLLNAVVEAYMAGVVEEEHKVRLTRLQFLEKLYTQYQEDLKKNRASLRKQAELAGGADKDTVALQSQFNYENYASAQRIRMETRNQILQAEADLEYYQAKVDDAPPAPPVAPRSGGPSPEQALTQLERNDPEIRAIENQIAQLQDQIEHGERITRKKANDPFLKPLREKLADARADLADRRAFLAQQAAQRGEDPAAPGGENSALAMLNQTKERLRRLKIYDDSLKDDMKNYQIEAREKNVQALDLQTEQDRVNLASETAQKVGTEVQSLRVELNAPRRVTVVDKAKPPKTKDELKKVKAAGGIAMVTFLATVAGITFLEVRARRIASVNEVVQHLGLTLVGSLPALPNKGQRGLSRRNGTDVERWRSRLVESIDATRTMLLHASRTESIRVVMITSALKGEGKTSLSSHLATSLARAGRKTLLIDCDLRKPALHRLFDVPPEPGMCEILRGEAEPSAVIHPTPAGELDVITAGRCDPLALQILAQEGARGIFEALAKDYDFLIVDTSPVLPVADALLLGQQVDAVLFSIMHEVSCVPTVQQAYARLASLNIRVLGAVVNGAGGSNYGYDGYAVYGQTTMAGA